MASKKLEEIRNARKQVERARCIVEDKYAVRVRAVKRARASERDELAAVEDLAAAQSALEALEVLS